MDNVEAGRLATEHLIARGCRHLTFATVAGMIPSRAHKIEGFLSAVQRHGLFREGMIVEEKTQAAYGDAEDRTGRSLAQKSASSRAVLTVLWQLMTRSALG